MPAETRLRARKPFHRLHSARRGGRETIAAEVHSGTKRDAILYSVGANAAHGLRRTNDDKRQAVLTLLRDPEWSQWSNREIARRCAVSHVTVNKFRTELSGRNFQTSQERKVKRGGQTYMQNTENIGRKQPTEFTGADGITRKPAEERAAGRSGSVAVANAEAGA